MSIHDGAVTSLKPTPEFCNGNLAQTRPSKTRRRAANPERGEALSHLLRHLPGLIFLLAMAVSAFGQFPLPNQPLFQDPHNNRYVIYQSHPIVLVGASGEYLPHVNTNNLSFFCAPPDVPCPHNSVISTEYCTYDVAPTNGTSTIKAKQCIDYLKQNKLNLMRIWVSLNSSPGTAKTTDYRNPPAMPTPYPHEQPFAWNANKDQWDLTSLDTATGGGSPGTTSFFANLVDIVSYAQSQGVIVEVTLFDPWSPRLPDSPYQQKNQNPVIGQFNPNSLFVQADNSCSPPAGLIDCKNDTAALQLRARQKAVLTQVVTALYPYNNVYYELANEADFNANLSEANIMAWHNYMANAIQSVECSVGGAAPACTPSLSWHQHMIAVNFTGSAAISGTQAGQSGPVRIINGHYARISGDSSLPASPVSALDMLRTYNMYSNGVQTAANKTIYGFNESQALGFDFSGRTADSARAEAWEFLVNGGGTYDLYAFDWGNSSGSLNSSGSTLAIGYLGELSMFMSGLPHLEGMQRTSDNANWINIAPYGSADSNGSNLYWAAMQDGKSTWLLYIHHSTISSGKFAQYIPQCWPDCSSFSGGYGESFTISDLHGCTNATYNADWLDPRTLQVIKSENSWSEGTTPQVQTPGYSYDVLLHVSSNCPYLVLKVASNGTGAGTVSSDTGAIQCGTVCSAVVNPGTNITLNPQSAPGSVFSGWSGDACSGSSSCALTITQDTDVTAAFSPLVNGATFVGQGLPSSMMRGLLYYASVTMQNTGTTTWDQSSYSLAPQNPAYNTSWGLASAPLLNNVVPGGTVTIPMVVKAPIGTANFQWQMQQATSQGTSLFGDVSPNPVFTLTNPPMYYQGCWDDDSGRALPALLSSGGETVESCQLKAANGGYLYAGLQGGGQCWGGNNLGRYPVPEEQCNAACTANAGEICGGDFRNSIWSTVQIVVSWVKPSAASYGPANTLTVQGTAIRGTGTVQAQWRDDTAGGGWITIAAQSTPNAGNIWANTIPSSNYCHTYDVQAIYSGVTSATFTYNGVTSGYCSETGYVAWIQPQSSAGFGPPGSLAVAGNATGAPAGSTVSLWWSDLTAGTGWSHVSNAATPDANGTWFGSIPGVNYTHQYSVYATYDAFSTQSIQGACTYAGNGSIVYCPH
jgi:hypothetical protein